MNKSVWIEKASLPKFDKLKGAHKTDVLIIGGGICGILCAHFLEKAGIDYILCEGDKICSGITKNTTAKITSQHGLIYSKLIGEFGKEKAQMYLDANEKAIREYEELAKGIDCDFEKKDSYTYSLYDRGKIEKEVDAVNSLGHSAEFKEDINLPLDIKGAVRFKNQAQFNPLKFIEGIAGKLNIYEDSFVRDIGRNKAETDMGEISAEKIIVTTHYPFINKHGSYFLKLYQHRSYVSAFEYANMVEGMYVDEDIKGLSFRTYGNLLLIGGGSHRTGKNGGNWAEIENFAQSNYKNAKLKFRWATQDCMSLDGVPYIGNYSKNTPDMYVATGFNKWGMTSSMVAAEILSLMVQDKESEYAEVFSPSRSISKPQLLVNVIESAINLLTPATKRCPHLGCALKWNKAEHSWDCPCHGSRFREDGKLIDNPSCGDAKV